MTQTKLPIALEKRRIEYPCGCLYVFGKLFPKDPIDEEVIAYKLCETHSLDSFNSEEWDLICSRG